MTPAVVVEPQHISALAKANAVRRARSDTKREVRQGELTVTDALDRDECQSMHVSELLIQQHRWGVARAARALVGAGIGEAAVVGNLTDRQRRALFPDAPRRSHEPQPEPKLPSEPDPTRGIGHSPKACKGCGIPLAERTAEMLCGFCTGEREAAA